MAKDHFPGRKPEVLKVKYNNMRWQERGLKMQGGQVFPSQSTPDLLQALDFLLKTQRKAGNIVMIVFPRDLILLKNYAVF